MNRPRLEDVQSPSYWRRDPQVLIRRVENQEDRLRFVRCALDRYAQDPFFVPPIVAERCDFINPQENPYFAHARHQLFLAERQGRVVGRIAAVVDSQYNAFHQQADGAVGLFECEDDAGVASSLFQAACDWLLSAGATRAIGPLNLAFHHDCGILVEGFSSSPSMMMPYNPPYYASLFLSNGFSPWKDLLSYDLPAAPLPAQVSRLADHARKQTQVRRLDFSDVWGEGRRIKEIYESMIKPGWGFAPLSDAEFFGLLQRLKPLLLLRPELCLVAETNGEAVGFSITLPDVNPALKAAKGSLSRFGLPIGLAKMVWTMRKTTRLRVLLFGIKPGFRKRGIDALLAEETMRTAMSLGYQSGELGWVAAEDRLLRRMVEATGARRIKTYRLFERNLRPTSQLESKGSSVKKRKSRSSQTKAAPG